LTVGTPVAFQRSVTTQPIPPEGEWLITIAASAGGIPALSKLVASLPHDLPAAVVVLQHRVPQPTESYLNTILGRAGTLPVLTADEGQTIERGKVYVPRSDLHLTVTPQKRFSYVNGRRIKHLLSSANPLFESAAEAYKDRLLAIVLTGHGSDGTDGVQAVRTHGGVVIAQDPASAEHRSMPQAAIQSGAVDFVLPLEAIGQAVNAIVRGRPLPYGVATN
jgi:two-component system chemotaxis response regulator CheB